MELEIWSDVACPWCYLGKRRMEAALEQFEDRGAVAVTWRSFELDPSAPRESGVDVATHLAQKYGMTREQALASQRRLMDLAAGDGLELHLDRAQRTNTFDAHRLVKLGAEHGLADEVKERMMRAYHSDAELVGDPATLARLGVEAGLDEAEVAEVLAGDRFADEVRADELEAASLGIDGVPFFVVDRQFAARGAQGADVLLGLLRHAAAASTA
jgi:predicted DsbA family dithiol-disulfide isomerase